VNQKHNRVLGCYQFWWATANNCCHLKKIVHTNAIVEKTVLVLHIQGQLPPLYVQYQHGFLYNRVGMWKDNAIFAQYEHFLTRLLKNRGGILYFSSRLYNCDCIFSIFLSQLHLSQFRNRACKHYITAIKYFFLLM